MAGFAAQVDAWVRETEDRIERVFKTAAQFVIEDVSMRTPVDTGTLRASWTVTLDAPLPLRDDIRPNSIPNVPQDYKLAIAGAGIGTTIYASFVAGYAVHVEYGTSKMTPRAMVRGAAQMWQSHVDNAVAAAKATAGQ